MKKVFAIALIGLLATGALSAKVYDFFITCNDGSTYKGMLSEPTTSDAFAVLGDLAEFYCGN